MSDICQPFNISWAIQIIRSSHSESYRTKQIRFWQTSM